MMVRIDTNSGYMLVNPAQVVCLFHQFTGEIYIELANEKEYQITQDEAAALVAALGGETKKEPVVMVTWIVSAERDQTKNSGSPMWRCTTESGERVNVFKHTDPAKDTFHLFAEADYGMQLEEIPLYATVDFDPSICVSLAKNGQWWEVIAVHPADNEPVEHEACF
jgi:hypothetical protein